MSIDLNWETLTSGPDGARYAERVRDFVHTKFQTIPFPKFIKSVQVHSFTFGTIPPDIEIKEICDPYPEFYEEDEDDYAESDSDPEDDAAYSLKLERERRRRERRNDSGSVPSTPSIQPPPYSLDGGRASGPGAIAGFRGAFSPGIPDTFPGRVGVTGVSTPLFNRAGSSSNLHYFHSALSTGFTTAGGTTTPTLSAFVSPPPSVIPARASTAASTGSVPSPPSTADSADHERDPTTPPPPPQAAASDSPLRRSSAASMMPRLREPRDEDTQIVSRVRYAGDVRLELTAELLLEYPVSAFAALPVRLVVTGCRFDGLACLAYIRRRAHFCFLDEERGGGDGEGSAGGSLLKEIKVESEIGEKGRGKQVLKNVGKVERFVLEQVRRIFEEEFVFPSSWTFLV
ncbi:uncharacterized protein LAJ45_01552 [Morchella importuna]|uniref:uncharacterized protein n=1 Tax=Morchella importuna TaxID=1174673 RepID=UPI001E8CAC63|nr:uncharacterized protein LAJ45_01552 [Morchella importuna]KAH8153785.1 hypothetical protein LAJ45_01552 [Morchella importuna]